MLFVLAPLPVLTRFIAMRSPAVAMDGQSRPMLQLAQLGTPIVSVGALLLFLGGDWIGHVLCHQHGAWWSALVAALSLSLPIRYFGSILRGLMLALGRFSDQAMIDAVAQWLVAPLFLFLGLSMNDPGVTYLSLIGPEVVSISLVWLTLGRSRRRASLIPLPSKRLDR
jgi:hypothetical protein